mmetsp:Transcript_134332/g.287335  ORF Transcript_134332/g.287335 Transcript_134332/m.287335 type:complete len:205 (+) Transcript_134332:470-1084(+)
MPNSTNASNVLRRNSSNCTKRITFDVESSARNCCNFRQSIASFVPYLLLASPSALPSACPLGGAPEEDDDDDVAAEAFSSRPSFATVGSSESSGRMSFSASTCRQMLHCFCCLTVSRKQSMQKVWAQGVIAIFSSAKSSSRHTQQLLESGDSPCAKAATVRWKNSREAIASFKSRTQPICTCTCSSINIFAEWDLNCIAPNSAH